MSAPAAAVTLTRMRWWHVAEVMVLEQELFGAERWSAESFWSELAERETRHYEVALADRRVVGYAGLGVFGEEAHVLTIGVTRAAQGRGTGTALLRDLIAAADARGARRVLLEVRAENAAAQRLYERHGFRRIALRRGYYQPSGSDAVVMARD